VEVCLLWVSCVVK